MKKVVEIRRGELVPDEAKWLRDFTKREKDGERYQVRSGDGGYCYQQDYVEVTYDVFEIKQ